MLCEKRSTWRLKETLAVLFLPISYRLRRRPFVFVSGHMEASSGFAVICVVAIRILEPATYAVTSQTTNIKKVEAKEDCVHFAADPPRPARRRRWRQWRRRRRPHSVFTFRLAEIARAPAPRLLQCAVFTPRPRRPRARRICIEFNAIDFVFAFASFGALSILCTRRR